MVLPWLCEKILLPPSSFLASETATSPRQANKPTSLFRQGHESFCMPVCDMGIQAWWWDTLRGPGLGPRHFTSSLASPTLFPFAPPGRRGTFEAPFSDWALYYSYIPPGLFVVPRRLLPGQDRRRSVFSCFNQALLSYYHYLPWLFARLISNKKREALTSCQTSFSSLLPGRDDMDNYFETGQDGWIYTQVI